MPAMLNSRLLIYTCKLKRPSPSLPLMGKTYLKKRRSAHDLGVERDNLPHEYSSYFVASHRTFSAIHRKAHYAAVPHRGVLPQSVFGIFALLNKLQLKVGLCAASFPSRRQGLKEPQNKMTWVSSLLSQNKSSPLGRKHWSPSFPVHLPEVTNLCTIQRLGRNLKSVQQTVFMTAAQGVLFLSLDYA